MEIGPLGAEGARWSERPHGGRIRQRERRQARRGRYDKARAGRRDSRCGRTRKRGERTARSLGSRFPRLRSIPLPSLASLFPSSPPSARTTAPHSTPLCRSFSRARVCSSFDLPLVASRFDSRVDHPFYPVIRFFSSASFLSFSVDSRFFTYNRT